MSTPSAAAPSTAHKIANKFAELGPPFTAAVPAAGSAARLATCEDGMGDILTKRPKIRFHIGRYISDDIADVKVRIPLFTSR